MARVSSGELVPLEQARTVFHEAHQADWGAIDVRSVRALLDHFEVSASLEFLVFLRSPQTPNDLGDLAAAGLRPTGVPGVFAVTLSKREALALAKHPEVRQIIPHRSDGQLAGTDYPQPWVPLDSHVPSSHLTSGFSRSLALGTTKYYGAPAFIEGSGNWGWDAKRNVSTI